MGQPTGRLLHDAMTHWWSHWWHHVILACWLTVCVAVYARHGGQSWHFLATGARSLLCLPPTSAGQLCGLHVYAVHPDLQIGPLSLLLAAPAVLLRRADGLDLARLGMAATGWVILAIVERTAVVPPGGPGRPEGEPEPEDVVVRRRRRVLLAGLAFFPAWADLAVGFGHLDDVLALLFTVLAIRQVVRQRPETVGWCLAAATMSKPWAVAFLPLLLALRAGRRGALARAVLPVLAVAGLFIVADPSTLHAAAFRIPNAASSSLRLLGITSATPPWDRPVQFGLGILLGGWAVRQGRWRAVVMIAAATRIMLDPQVYSYYTAGVMVGTLVWDVQERPGRVVPVWTWATFVALFAVRYLPVAATTLAGMRLIICMTLILFALFAPGALSTLIPPARTRRGSATQATSAGAR